MRRPGNPFWSHLKRNTAPLALSLAAIAVLEGIAGAASPVPPKRGTPIGVGTPPPISAADSEHASDDRTLSPFFFVHSDDPSLDALPLKSTVADVSISGVIADVKITQTYRNEGRKSLEAIYVFPASTRAAVYGMKMRIGERMIVAEIQKREEARRTYEQARQRGQSASLLEQQRPNVFQMNVANILPGDEITTELHYTELLVPTDGTYELVYPTVVGPRYSNQPAATAPPSEKWVANPYLHEGQKPPYTFDMTVRLSTGIPIQELSCSSHPVDIQFTETSKAEVRLKKGEEASGNRDFILKYRLAGKQVHSGLLLYEGQRENHFLLTVQPPDRVTPKDIPKREYVFIVDVSGSMHGFPLEVSKKLLKNLLQTLREKDSFNILLFSGGSSLLSEQSLPATPENLRRAVELLDRQQGGGGTELLPALQRALALPRTEGAARVFVIATDGYVTVEAESFELLQKQIGQASFFSFGIGSSVNRFLIEGLARAGAGESFVLTKPDEAPARAETFRKLIEAPVLTQIKLDLGGFDAYDLEPTGIPDLFAQKPVVVTGKWRGRPQGTITLSGVGGAGPYRQALDVSRVRPDEAHRAVQFLWARSRIARMADMNRLRPNDERTLAVRSLGLEYRLLTAYTSFVAVDSRVRNAGGDQTPVTQPLPLPEGVSDTAVGGAMMPVPAGRAMMRTRPALPAETAETQSLRKSTREAQGQGAPADQPDPARSDASTPHLVNLEVQGGLSEPEVRAVVERQLPELSTCLGKRHGGLFPVELKLHFVVDVKGRITPQDVRITAKQSLPRDLERCLLRTLRAWRFPRSGSRDATTVTASIRF